MKYPQAIQNLIDELSKLPAVGPKTAERYVFSLLKRSNQELNNFAKSIAELKANIIVCRECNAVSESNPCEICSDPKRNKEVVCVVANTRDMIAIESTKQFNGQYHVLGGVLNTIEGVTPEKLKIKSLEAKIKKNQIKEVILALNPNIEGETTSLFLSKIIKPYNIKISRLAKGLSTGSDLEYADEMTLSNALKYRNQL
jgi:recombination protein RecR